MAVKVPTSMSRLFGSKRAAIGILSALAMFMMSVNYDLIETARMMALHAPYSRELRTLDLGNGQCSIDLSEDAATDPVAENATHTLLTSYPGSGKRFTWMAIKALTNHEIAGDWDFSGTLDLKPLTVKTSWPHHEGNWNWGSQMDQVLLLVRNPRWAIPSYHNLRYELNYSNGYADSVKRILNTYTSRPNVKQWEDWRDANAETEIDLWAEFIDFWMSGGIESGTNTTHEYCLTRGIDCKPVAVMDFDRFYEEHPNSEVFKLDNVLQSSANVEVVASAIHACVLDKIRDGATDSSGNVMGHNNMRAQNTGIHAHMYKFTSDLMQQMIDKVVELKTKYSAAEYADQVAAQELVTILEVYYADLVMENTNAGY